MTAISGSTTFPKSLTRRLEQTKNRAQEIEATLGERTEDQLLLKVDSDLGHQELKDLAREYGATLQKEIPIPEVMQESFDGKLLVLETGPGLSEAQTLAAIEGDERVLLAATNDDLTLVNGKNVPAFNDDRTPTDPKDPKPDEKLPNDLNPEQWALVNKDCLLYTSPSPRDRQKSRMPSSA